MLAAARRQLRLLRLSGRVFDPLFEGVGADHAIGPSRVKVMRAAPSSSMMPLTGSRGKMRRPVGEGLRPAHREQIEIEGDVALPGDDIVGPVAPNGPRPMKAGKSATRDRWRLR